MSNGSTRAHRTARQAALARAEHRCQQLRDAAACQRPAVAALCLLPPGAGGDAEDVDNLRAACARCARQAYQRAAQLENARRTALPVEQRRPPPPITAASSTAAIRRAVLARADQRCEHRDGATACRRRADRCRRPARFRPRPDRRSC